MTFSNVQLPVEGVMPSLDNATEWLNSPALTTEGLRGKVVLVNFCTYTCINWLRTLPFVRAWEQKYRAHGLVVIGVHTPEFAFEKNIDNVRRSVSKMALSYPMAIDNNYAVWQDFDNHYWPASYFVDASGRIRHHRFGEGDYERSELVIQALLSEAGAKNVDHHFVEPDAWGVEVSADWANLQSQENYLGYQRAGGFSSPGGIVRDKPHVYSLPRSFSRNSWALSGDWTVGKQAILLNQSRGRVVCVFHARDLHLVMGPAVAGTLVRYRVLVDGKEPGSAHGIDIDEQGNGLLEEQRMYNLVRQPGSVTDRGFEIEFVSSGAEAFAFTFG